MLPAVGIICAAASIVSGAAGSCDNWNFNSSNPALYVGGNYNQNENHGLFYVNYTNASNANGNIGARLHFQRPHAGQPNGMARIFAHPSVKIGIQETD